MNITKDNLNHVVILSSEEESALFPIINNISQTHAVINIAISSGSLQSEIEYMSDMLSEINNPVVIIANSFNSFVAIYYAKKYAKNVKHLILLGCPPFNDEYINFDEHSHSPQLVDELSELRKNNKLIETIKKIKCPVTFMHGKQDSNPYEGVQVVLNDNNVDFEFILYDNCDAMPWDDTHRAPSFFKMLNILVDEF